MKLKTSQTLGGITLGMLLILGSQITASAQNREPYVDRIMRDTADQKRRDYEASIAGTVVRYNLGAPRNAKELSKYQGIASKLKTSPEKLLEEFSDKSNWFAMRMNVFPLTFNKFLLAKFISNNLAAIHPDITTNALIWGLTEHKSYARTMRNLGLSLEEAKSAEKNAEREIKESKR